MTTTLTPPPATAGGPAPGGAEPSRGPSRVIAVLVICFGALVILGTVGSAVFSTLASAAVHTTTRSVDVGALSDDSASLRTDVAGGVLRIEFTDVREAELEVTGAWGADRWTLETEGSELVVASPRVFGPGWLFGGIGDAVLRLPQSLEGLDADLHLSAGELQVEGDFGRLDLVVGAGRVSIEGSAAEVSAQLNAGRGELDLADVREASFTVSAGSLDASLSGRQPESMDLGVSAGSLILTVPEGEYDVTSDVSAGGFDNRLDSRAGADSAIEVRVSVGHVVLRSASSPGR